MPVKKKLELVDRNITKPKSKVKPRKKKEKVRFAIIDLPYFKKGDDLAFFLEKNLKNPAKALKEHSDMMYYSGYLLEELSKRVAKNKEVRLTADTHFIGIEGPESFINKLVDEELASYFDEDSEEEEQ